MTQVKTPTELNPVTIRLQDRVRELEHDQAAGQEVLRAQQAEIAEGEATIENLNSRCFRPAKSAPRWGS